MEMKRYVIQARLLGLDKNATKRGRENEYAIEVVLSDESQYTMFRTLKEIANFHTKVMNKFKVEAGYFKKEERVIPECPIKQTIFGPQRAITDDKSFSRLLHHYLKELPALPAAVVKSDLVTNFFSLKASDLDAPGSDDKTEKKKKGGKVDITDDSLISGPLSLKSYYTVAEYKDKKTNFSFKEGATVQVIQKDPSGWWRVDARGLIGWAPASYLVPVNASDLQEEAEENETLIEQDKVGTRYISISAYQASRDDELSFVRGAVVRLLKKYVDGWWLVRYNGGEGFVPGAMFRKFDKRQATLYVKKIKRNFSSRGTTRIVPTVKPQWMNSRYQRNRQVTRNLQADSRNVSAASAGSTRQSEEEKPIQIAVPNITASPAVRQQEKEPTNGHTQAVNGHVTPTKDQSSTHVPTYISQGAFEGNGISIAKGDSVKVLDGSENDWWFITDTKGAQGWAPAGYLQPVDKPGLNSRSDSGLSLDTSIAASEMLEDEDDEDELLDDMDNDSLDLEECYVVIKDYTKGAIDELDLFEGQVVCVIDDSDKDLWYVNADGKEGWVPSNILRLMAEDEMEDPSTSRESTPVDSHASADNSEASDDEHLGLKRRGQIRRIPDGSLGLAPRPRSVVVSSRENSPNRSPIASPSVERKHPPKLPRRRKLQSSDGSDSDPVNSSDISIMVDDTTSLEELEKAAKLAERQAREAQLRAEALHEKIRLAKLRKQ